MRNARGDVADVLRSRLGVVLHHTRHHVTSSLSEVVGSILGTRGKVGSGRLSIRSHVRSRFLSSRSHVGHGNLAVLSHGAGLVDGRGADFLGACHSIACDSSASGRCDKRDDVDGCESQDRDSEGGHELDEEVERGCNHEGLMVVSSRVARLADYLQRRSSRGLQRR